jgi:hypothetical protein
MHQLAQLSPDADPHAIGSWVLVAAVILGLGYLIMQIWARLSPTPPLWKEHYEAARREAREGDEAIRRDLEAKTDQLHGRVSKLRDEIRGDYEKASEASREASERTAREVKGTMEKMLTIHGEAMSAVSKLDGKLEGVVQQGHATQAQLQRHIEKGQL